MKICNIIASYIYSDAGMDTSIDISEGKLVNDTILTPTQSAAHLTGENDWSYEFHENHGRNIQLETKTIARIVASYNQGIAYSYKYKFINRNIFYIILYF